VQKKLFERKPGQTTGVGSFSGTTPLGAVLQVLIVQHGRISWRLIERPRVRMSQFGAWLAVISRGSMV